MSHTHMDQVIALLSLPDSKLVALGDLLGGRHFFLPGFIHRDVDLAHP